MNSGLSFETPGFLFALLGLIPLIIADFLRRRISMRRFFAAALGGGGFLGRRYFLSGFFFWIFLASLIVALAGPCWGSRAVAEYRRGLDVVFALDLSRSMEIRDVPALGAGEAEISRLDRGRSIVREALAAVPGIRSAAAIGRGRGLLAVPLTGDAEAVPALLEGLGGLSLTGGGTNLEALINAAASAFAAPFPARRLIVLVSDGEALSGSLRGALDRLREEDISLSALGLGSDEGSPVPQTGENSPPALSSRQGETLRYAADRTGGLYIDGNGPAATALLYEHLWALAPEKKTPGGRREPMPRRHLFIIAALLFFGASRLSLMRGRKKSLAAALLVFLGSCSPLPGKLLIMEGNFFYSRAMYADAAASYLRALDHAEAAPYAEYGLGAVYFSREAGEAAREHYAAAEKLLETVPPGEHRELRFRIPYNRGLVFFGEEDYAAAAGSFRAALEIDGSRIEAKRNLELSLLSLSRKKEAAGQKHRDGPPGEAEAALFNYLRLKEQNQWKSREWIEEESPPGPDY
jgi:Ca-activated chloride channel family protein